MEKGTYMFRHMDMMRGASFTCLLVFLLLAFLLSGTLAAQEEGVKPAMSARIEKMRKEIDTKGHGFTAGYNEAMNYTLEQLTGYRRAPEEVRARAMSDRRGPSPSLPKRWNWMDHNGVSSIKEQHPSGTCWAFATVGAIESNIMIHEQSEVELSEQYLVSCNQEGMGCNTGGWEAHRYHSCSVPPGEFAQDGEVGAVLEVDYPYLCPDYDGQIPDTPSCAGTPANPLPRIDCIDSWAYVGPGELPPADNIKQAIFDYGPVYAAVMAEPYFQAYTGGVFDRCVSGGTNHAITLVGWDDTQGENGIWYMKNSWGTDWGEAGFMRIQYECNSIGSDPSYVVYRGGALTSNGLVYLDDDAYSCTSDIGVIVRDRDLIGAGTQLVILTTTGGDAEQIFLGEIYGPGSFGAAVEASGSAVTPGDGILQVSDGETLTVTYVDADDGRGGIDVTKTYSAYVDCASPVFGGLLSAEPGNGYVALAWDAASDPSDPIKYNVYRSQTGGEIGQLAQSASGLGYRDYGVIAGETYFYVVRALDGAGNEDDNMIELSAVPLARPLIERASQANDGTEGDDASSVSSVSGDGTLVAFESSASSLVPGDTNQRSDIFLYDSGSDSIERLSMAHDGTQADQDSNRPRVNEDGRFIAFDSYATNLIPSDTNGKRDVFLIDLHAYVMKRVSVSSAGTEGAGTSSSPCISADGRFVGFESFAADLVPGDTNWNLDVFVFDTQTDSLERVSVSSGGIEGDGYSSNCSISGNGRYVAFESSAGNLVPGDTNGQADVFVFDRTSATIDRVSVADGGGQGNSASLKPSISADGRYVAFESSASNLVSGDTNGKTDVFVFDRTTATIDRVSVADDGGQGLSLSGAPSICADGRYVAFQSYASNLVPGDTNNAYDIFVRDRLERKLDRISMGHDGAEADDASFLPSISTDGRSVAFESMAPNLVPADGNGFQDIFLVTIPGPLEVTTSSLENGKVGVSYHAALEARGGMPPCFWEITAGELPAGLSLESTTGVISGTPSAEGTQAFTVEVRDALDDTDSRELSITTTACFIAMAAFGTPMAEEIEALRTFRDRTLLAHEAGEAFVRFYYGVSPPVAEFIQDKELAKAIVRAGLRPLVWLSVETTKGGGP